MRALWNKKSFDVNFAEWLDLVTEEASWLSGMKPGSGEGHRAFLRRVFKSKDCPHDTYEAMIASIVAELEKRDDHEQSHGGP